MSSVSMFKDLAIIIIFAKAFGLVARKLNAPQVVGEIIAGLIIGPSVLGLVQQSDFLAQMAEIGVILLMFSAGLETDLKELLKTGPIAFVIACIGVGVPCAGGYLLYSAMYGFAPTGSDAFFQALFIGVIITATSVSITVQTLREMGHLKGRVGTTILSAAIIDDVIGIVLLTFVLGFKDTSTSPAMVGVKTILFFLLAAVIGFIFYKVFKWLDKRNPRSRRVPIAGLALCFALSYIAEKYFGIADVTGAYVAGLVLCQLKDSDYIARKMDINSYMLFGPIFFASIGLKTQLSGLTMNILIFSIFFILVALLTKVIGCGLIARLCKFSWKDSLKIGVGMMTRGEVALIVAQKGLSMHMIESIYFAPVILLIMVSSLITPIFLKILYRGEPKEV